MSQPFDSPRMYAGGLLRVDPERRFHTPPQKAGLGAVERVKKNSQKNSLTSQRWG